ncbi:MAG: aldehyde ferredoxin oxidoreductase family protein [Desulfobacteraceae bacterium]|jgi:aldehyde:ferredoxin oxidoreductase|nr:MAG: aldehyde ferredoxin oxidoreductase family protein [Desulfobacteraceae bacterium]
MMVGGYAGRIGFVELTSGKISEEKLDEDLVRSFIGGYGLGVRILSERQKPGIDALGPESILGFTTGPLTGTMTPSTGRYTVVCKSPLTGGWGDANSGGYFGRELKYAGWDAIFVSGIATSPKYLLVTNDGLELKDGSHLWGRDTINTEEMLRRELGVQKMRVASIGPASERMSLISGIVNDKGRVAARSGVGAVMGSKRLKAVVVHGNRKVPVINRDRLSRLSKTFIKEISDLKGFPQLIMDFGTCGMTESLVFTGATPVKNWLLSGEKAFPTSSKLSDTAVTQYQTKRYGCANCPIACGGVCRVPEGPYPLQEVKKPEYETLAAFGTMCMNDDLLSIFKMNDMCNRSGIDSISAGSVLAFAMECFEKGIINTGDTDGINLTWGNSQAMIMVLDKIIRREGFGDVLADGVKVAAERIGGGAEECAIHVGGQEPGLHNPLLKPSRGTGFVCDPTPGRHTAAPMTRIDEGSPVIAPYPELKFNNYKCYEYKKKGPASATTSCYWQVGTCAGTCLLPVMFFGNYPLLDFLNAATGWDMDMGEVLETGARIQSTRQAFSIREGIKPSDISLPDRLVGKPPQDEGPLSGKTIDINSLVTEYWKAMGWDPETGNPTQPVY